MDFGVTPCMDFLLLVEFPLLKLALSLIQITRLILPCRCLLLCCVLFHHHRKTQPTFVPVPGMTFQPQHGQMPMGPA